MERVTFFNMHSGHGGEPGKSPDGKSLTRFRGDRVVVTVSSGHAGLDNSLQCHAQEQWTLVARGNCDLELDGRLRPLRTLDVAQIPSNTKHRIVSGTSDLLLANIYEAASLGQELPAAGDGTLTGADVKAPAAAPKAAKSFNMRDPIGGLPRKLAEGMYSSIYASDRLMVSVVRIEPNCKGSLHKHPHEQWGILIEGGGKRIAERGFTPVTAGDFWFTPGEELHTFEAGPTGAFILEVFSPPREDYLMPQ